jgi:ribosome-binding protein aMBF1 (putative translation factor)
MVAQNLKLGGREYVILDRCEYERLRGRQQRKIEPSKCPVLPKADERGLRPARETLRSILAGNIIKDRLALGWSQRELARRAGIRPETLSRIESGIHTPTVATVERIDHALLSAAASDER